MPNATIDSTPSPSTRDIAEIAQDLRIPADQLRLYGRDRAKVDPTLCKPQADRPPGRLVLVTAITPTPAGEGKTTTSVGLSDGLRSLGESVAVCLREPSLGPCFGIKGGGTGGGRAQLYPAVDINLHFTGDFHAITAAHNLLSAAVDNHIHRGNALDLDPRRILFKRVLDVNDRALRQMVSGLGGAGNGVPTETGFDITAASEIMAMLCLAEDAEDLRARIDRTLIGFTRNKERVLAKSFNVTGAMLALLRDALWPNIAQTLEGTPAFVHGGPFANIAHGCNSVMATRAALNCADWVVTEAGFGCDLGAEKFVDIKCQSAGLDPVAVVLVATVRALKMHGGVSKKNLKAPDADAVARGLGNLDKHIENVRHFGRDPVVVLNRFADDTDAEIAQIRARCEALNVEFCESEHYARGGRGAETLARKVMAAAARTSDPITPLYRWEEPVQDKVRKVATKMYGASDVVFTASALKDIRVLVKAGYGDLPVCMAKTPASLSDNPKLVGRPTDFEVTVRNVVIAAGAGFLVVLTGDIMRMPGLPKVPRAEHIDLVDGDIVGLVT